MVKYLFKKELVSTYIDSNRLSVKEFARRCGISNTAVSLIISGDRCPTLDTIFKIAAVMGCSAHDLIV